MSRLSQYQPTFTIGTPTVESTAETREKTRKKPIEENLSVRTQGKKSLTPGLRQPDATGFADSQFSPATQRKLHPAQFLTLPAQAKQFRTMSMQDEPVFAIARQGLGPASLRKRTIERTRVISIQKKKSATLRDKQDFVERTCGHITARGETNMIVIGTEGDTPGIMSGGKKPEMRRCRLLGLKLTA
jgi:hypothetical protein